MPRSMIRSMTRTMRRPGPSALTLLTLLVGTAIGALGVVSGAAAGPPGSLPPGYLAPPELTRPGAWRTPAPSSSASVPANSPASSPAISVAGSALNQSRKPPVVSLAAAPLNTPAPKALETALAPLPDTALDAAATPKARSAPKPALVQVWPEAVRAVVGHVLVLPLPAPVSRVVVGDPRVADYRLISRSELYLLGKSIGTTNVLLWQPNGQAVSVAVTVGVDLAPLAESLRQSLPDEKDIALRMASGSVVLSGTVTDLAAAEAALNLTQAFARQLVRYLGAAPTPVPVAAVTAGVDKAAPAGELGTQVINLLRVRDDQRLTPLTVALRQALPHEHDIRLALASGTVVLSGTVSNTLAADTAMRLAESFGRKNRAATSAEGSSALNLLGVRDAQQVMLDVRIAEVSKSLLDKLGVGVQAGGGGGTRWNILSNFLGGGGAAAGLLFRNGSAINLDAEKNDGLVRILAEPTIVAMSGQEGSFLVGGTVFIPVAQTGTAFTLQEREFGVGLKFVPTVLDGGRVSLKVATEVSEISKESVRNPGSAALLPAFTMRRVATSVQLQDGQSLVIGGLIRNNSSANTNAYPFLGELPILGALFRSSQFVSDLTELVVVVRTSLVKATDAAPALPTDTVRPPSRRDLFLDGQLQGRPPEPEAGGAK